MAVRHILTNKQYELISLLSQNKEVMTSEQISDRIGLSTKTIQRYIELINKYLEKYDLEIISMRGYGYILQGNIKTLEDVMLNLSPNSYNRRIKDISLYLLSNEYITIEKIGNKMSYSVSTLNKLIPKVKQYLELYNLKFKSKPYYGLKVVGSELNIRTLMIDCAFDKTLYGEISCSIENISNEEFNIIKHSIFDFLHKHEIVIADDDVIDLIMRTIIIVSRCKQNCLLLLQDLNSKNNMVQKMIEIVSENINITIPTSETAYLSMYFDLINGGLNNKMLIIQEDINDFVIKALEEMKNMYGDFVIQEQVIKSLILHLSLMFNRISHKHYVKNPLLQDIKANYTLEMNYAITFVKLLEEHFNLKIMEDELGYLALYFALSNGKPNKVKRVIILCNYGIATSQLIKERIQEEFPNLEVIGIYPLYYLEVVMNQDIDLIISTVALDQFKLTKPYIVINQVLDEDSLQSIKKLLKETGNNSVFKHFSSDAFFLLKCSTKEEVLAEMSQRMLELGILDEKTIETIYEREKISSTDIGNLVAIPHALIHDDKTPGIGIAILEKPILWNKEKVQLIFMIALNAEELKQNNIFKHLYRIVKDISTVNRLIESKNFETFAKLY